MPKTEDQLSYLIQMDNGDSELDFWRGPSALESPVDVMADPQFNRVLEDELKSRGMDPSILVQDVQRSFTTIFLASFFILFAFIDYDVMMRSFLDVKRVQLLRDQSRSSNFTENYHTYQEVRLSLHLSPAAKRFFKFYQKDRRLLGRAEPDQLFGPTGKDRSDLRESGHMDGSHLVQPVHQPVDHLFGVRDARPGVDRPCDLHLDHR